MMVPLYATFAKVKKGINLRKFNKLWAKVSGIEHHPFIIDIFFWFDKETQDKTIDFFELVQGLNVV